VALQVDVDHRVPLVLGHVDDHAVTQDPGVVDEDVEVTEGLDGGVDEPLCALPGRHAVAVGERLASHAVDLVDHLLCRRDVAAGAVGRAAEVVDDHLGALGGEEDGVLAPDPPPGPGDDRHPSVKSTHALRHPFLVRWRRLIGPLSPTKVHARADPTPEEPAQ
jgi:hypothetical protein